MNFQLVKVSEVDALWPQLARGLDEALFRSGGDMSVGALFQQARAGSAFVIVAFDEGIKGAGVFRPETWQTGIKLRCLAFYGADFKDWRDEFMDAARALGRVCGTDTCIFEGRKGHEKLFPDAKVLRQLYEVK